MKVNFGAVATDGRGKIKGIVYSKNKSGSYVRGKVTPANPRTVHQSLVRASFAANAQAWGGTLTQSDRDQWVAYAASYPRQDIFGNSIQLSGMNMFIALNAVLQNLALTPVATPPLNNIVTPVPTNYSTLSVIAGVPNLQFDQTAAQVDGDDKYYLFAAAPLPPGRKAQKSDFRFLTALAPGVAAFPIITDISTVYIARFGPWQVGQRIAILVGTVRTGSGLISPGVKMDAIST